MYNITPQPYLDEKQKCVTLFEGNKLGIQLSLKLSRILWQCQVSEWQDFVFINTFFLGYLSSALNMLSLLPVFLCLYVSVQKALVSGGLWEAQLSVLNSFIRSPAVSCQGFSCWLVSEGRTGSVQHVGTRSQLLDWCSWSPWSLKVEEKFDLIMAVVSVHLFVLFVLRGLQCAIKRCRSKLNMQP